MPWPLFHALDDEWADLTRSAQARHAIVRWSDDHTLAAYGDLNAIIAALRDGARDPAAANRILAALAARAPADSVAARTMLQALIPGLVNVAKRLAHGHADDDLEAQVITEAVDRIRNYPLARRPRAIAANITWDVFGRITRQHRTTETPVADPRPNLQPTPDPSDEVNELLADALDTGRLRPNDACLLAAIAIGHDTIASRAQREGTTYKAMNERWRRARNRLRSAIAA